MNEHETMARARKAYRLARSLWDHDVRDARAVHQLGSDLRKAVEYDAGVNPASPQTWQTCAGILQAMVEEDASGRPVGASPSAMTRDEVVA